MNFAQGEFVMVGGMAAAWANTALKWTLVPSLLGMLAAVLVGVLLKLLAVRPVRAASPVMQIIVTIGASIVIRAAAALLWGTDLYYLPPLCTGTQHIAGTEIDLHSLLMLPIVGVCMLLLVLFFRFTRAGQAMQACAENMEAARLCGVRIGRMSTLAFAISALLGGIGGVMVTPLLAMSSEGGTMLGLKGFSAAILGGLGNPVGGRDRRPAAGRAGTIQRLVQFDVQRYPGPVRGDRVPAAASDVYPARAAAAPERCGAAMKFPQPISPLRLYRGPLLLLALIIVLPLLTLTAHGRYDYLLPLAQLCGIYAIIVTGLTLLMGFTGQVSLGHAGFYALGAYTAAVAVGKPVHAPLWLAILIALSAGALVSFADRLLAVALNGHYLALATLCLGIIIYGLINNLDITGAAAGLTDLPEWKVFGLLPGHPLAKVYFIWGIVLLVILWAVHLSESPVGRALRAIHGDEDAAVSLGVNTFATKLKVFVISGVLAALAGVLYAFVHVDSNLGPEEFNLMFSVQLLIMVVIGGLGSVWGGLAGAVLLTGMHELITEVGEQLGRTDMAKYEQLIFGLILVLIVIFSRDGLIPGMRRGMAQLTPPRRS